MYPAFRESIEYYLFLFSIKMSSRYFLSLWALGILEQCPPNPACNRPHDKVLYVICTSTWGWDLMWTQTHVTWVMLGTQQISLTPSSCLQPNLLIKFPCDNKLSQSSRIHRTTVIFSTFIPFHYSSPPKVYVIPGSNPRWLCLTCKPNNRQTLLQDGRESN